ncbi:Adenylyl cyclase-associated protein 2 [Acipenser ruthenus]|uniref:Adenylyl cyclase-associated protein 2 n=1 Tax=Acipenser ruthenus TaxID=7906 RepID=A0A662YYW6_ACIRT|nr:Adenylyl cyclase-associated protein 2 [Acipenser ruthenus]
MALCVRGLLTNDGKQNHGEYQKSGKPDLSPCLEAYDALLSVAVAEYLKNSKAIGEDVEKHAEMVNAALLAQRGFVKLASTHQQPPEADLAALLRPISAKIQEIQNFREKNRGSKMFNHLSAVSESIPALGWIAVAPKPGPYVKEMNDAATFYTNRVLKDYKDNDKRHVDWVRSYLQIWTELQAYIKKHHTTGLVWRLRHVLDGQKTHKNPELRSQGGVARQSPTKSHTPSPTSPKAPPQSHSPVLELEGKKWRVEYQDHANSLVISETELKHVVYAFKCSNSTLQIKGKINSIIVVATSIKYNAFIKLLLLALMCSVLFQVMGKVPTISVNKTEGCHIYLSEESLDCEIVSAKTSEVNILVPQDGDYPANQQQAFQQTATANLQRHMQKPNQTKNWI